MSSPDTPFTAGGQSSRGSPTDRIEQAAADWLALRDARALTPAEHAAYHAWLASDPRCQPALAEMESAWRAFEQLRWFPRPAGMAVDPDFFARPKEFRRRRAARPALGAMAAMAAAVAVAAIVWFKPGAPAAVPVATVPADPRFVHLIDGSEVELNAGAEVAEHFTPAERRVRLVRGEAHFTVAKNPARPFIVEAGAVAIQAVGTAFNVRLAPSTVEVLVTEGKVRVDPGPAAAGGPAGPAPAMLGAGQRTVVNTVAPDAVSPVVETLAPPAIDRLLAWQTSRLVFQSTPLAEAVARLNRHTAGRPGAPHLRIDDPLAGELRISGHIRADNIDGFVELLETSFGLAAERAPQGEIVLRRAP